MIWDRRTGGYGGPGTVITQHSSGKIFFQAANGVCSFSSIATVSDDRWHHIAVVMNTSAGTTTTVFVDGVSSGSATSTANWGWTLSTPIELGRSHDGYWYKYNGLLDDVRFYTRQLTPAEISVVASGGDDPIAPGEIGLNLQSAMQGVNGSAFIRAPFNVTDPAQFQTLRLTQRWSDGFAAFVNGTQITAQNAPAVLDWNSIATGPHSGATADTYDFAVPNGLLRAGSNVLAIQGLNTSASDPSLFISPKLDGLTAPVTTTGYTQSPTPGATNSAVKLNVGPFVSSVTKNPNPRPTGTAASPPLVITAKVTPSLNPLAANNPVQLKYVIMYGAEQTLNMTPTATEGTYTASIPTNTLGAGQMLRWRVVATDSNGATGTGPEFSDPNDNEQYYGTVAEDSSIETLLPVLYWFIQSTSALDASDTPTRCSLFYKAFGATGAGRFYDNVLVDRHGQSSSGFPKKSYNFDFNEDNRFEWDVTKKRTKDMDLLTNWGDKSKTHNSLTHETFATIGSVHHWSHQVRVQQVTPANAGTPANHFAFISDMLEDGDEDFLERNGRDPNGALYKVYDSLASSGGSEKKTRLIEPKTDLDALIAGLNVGNPLATRRRFAYDNLDIPQCVSYFVGAIITSHQDHGHKNYYVYRDSDGTREWSVLPWDVDLTWGRNWQDSAGYFTDTIFTNNDLDMYNSAMQGKGENRLYSLFVGNSDLARVPAPEFRDMVLRRLRTVMDGYFSAPNVIENRLQQLADLMDPPSIGLSDADRDRAKWGTWGNDGGNTVGGLAMRYHINQMRNVYLPGRRNFLNSATLFGATVPASQPVTAGTGLSIETVDFKPATTQAAEFFVIRNSNAHSVDLSGWQITGAVNFTFKPGTVLIPGGGVGAEHPGDLYVARNPFAFRQRASVPDDNLPAANNYRYVTGPYNGQLSARGETIELRDPTGALIKSKAWTPAPTAMQTALRISELNFAPVPPTAAESKTLSGVTEGDFEYIEFVNTGTAPLALTGATFDRGVTFTFPNFTLAAGARCLLVANQAAFQLRYPGVSTALIAGQYEGSLDNNGETLQLLDNIGEVILDFSYNNSWFPPSDEGGRSIVVRDPGASYKNYGLASFWALSGQAGGTPGAEENGDFANVYEGWRHDHFTSADFPTTGNPQALAATLQDADLDGLTNFAEYAFGRNPRAQDNRALTTATTVEVAGVRYGAIVFQRRHKALDVSYVVEASDDLATWRAIDLLVNTVPGGDLDEVTYRDDVAASSGKRFLRVRAVK